MTISHWRRTNTLGELRCDTLVLGAGVAGLSAALALRAHHVDTLVVDRAAVGSGASSRNAGYLMRGAADNYAAGVRTWGRDITRDLWRLTEHNLFLLRSRGAERLQTYQPRASCLLALTEEEQSELQHARSMMLEDGFEAIWIESGSDTVWRSGLARAGLVNPHDAVCNPCELLAMLRAQLHAPIIEHQEAIAIEESGNDVVVTLTDGRVRANRVIACLNAYAPLLIPEAALWVAPNRGQMLTLRAPAARLDMSYYANHGSEYFRAVEPGIFVIGGWRKRLAEAERTAKTRSLPPSRTASLPERYSGPTSRSSAGGPASWVSRRTDGPSPGPSATARGSGSWAASPGTACPSPTRPPRSPWMPCWASRTSPPRSPEPRPSAVCLQISLAPDAAHTRAAGRCSISDTLGARPRRAAEIQVHAPEGPST
ncbi:MAG: FAD-binding oxidoreductase [Phycisphaerales bacterium]